MQGWLDMDLSLLVIPITFFLGFLIGLKVHSTIGFGMSAVIGSVAWVLGLIMLAGEESVFTFDFFTQILMAAFGALASIFGWAVGANIDLLHLRRRK
jgi:hypothetical protein